MDSLIRQIEDELDDDTFKFYIYRDKENTGRFEITLYKDQTDDSDVEKSILMYSKLMTGRLLEPTEYDKFIDDLKMVAGVE